MSKNPEAYLSRAAIDASPDLLRSRTRAKSTCLDEADADALAARSRNPEALHADRELQDLVRQAVSRLGKTANEACSAFALDPEIKTENDLGRSGASSCGAAHRPHESVMRSRREDGEWDVLAYQLSSFDSMMTQFSDPRNAPEMLRLREQIRSWRFYDHFRTDVEAPARLPQIGTHTPVLSDDGSDLAAALRPLKATELSDGTLRYLLWIAALLTPRPPGLLVLNEPETSLHPDLLPPLGRLIANAAERTPVLVVTHAPKLIASLKEQDDSNSVTLEKDLGETRISGLEKLDLPVWRWASR